MANVVDMVLAMVEKFGTDTTRDIMDECDWLANDPIEAWKVEEYIQHFDSMAEVCDWYGFEDEEEACDQYYIMDCGKNGFIVFE